jgi:signal transduction histidine kinase
MMLNRTFLFLLFILGGLFSLPAQDSYRIQRFNTDNGLPSNGIKGLQWDEGTGFLWIATEAGVLRYNGAEFRKFDKTNMPEMEAERMMFILKDLQGRIYTSDEQGNIFFVMQNSLQFLGRAPIDTRLSSFKLTGLAASGKMFRQSADQPSAHIGFNFAIPINESHIILLQKDTSAETHIPGVYDYIFGTREPALITYVRPGSQIFYLNGRIFVFNRQQGFYLLPTDSTLQTPVPLAFEKNTADIPATAKTQVLWKNGMKNPILISGSRAWTLEYKDRQLIPRLICSAFPTDVLITNAQYDEKSGTLFLGTYSVGMIILRKQMVKPVRSTNPNLEKANSYYSQLALSNGSILTSEGHIVGGPPLPVSRLPVKGYFNNYILSTTEGTTDSLLWYSWNDTIFSYSYVTHRTASLYAGHGSITVGFLQSGRTLYVANAIGIGTLKDGRIDYVYRHPKPDMFPNVPFAMQELSPGVLAIACCNGLLRYNFNTHLMDTLFHYAGTCARALWQYKGYLFIGTYGKGIYIWKNEILKHIPSDKYGYLQYAHCFIPDKQGLCWISSNNGIFRARISEMIDAYEKNLPEIYYHYYGKNDGMDMTELNGGCTPCALSLNDSTLSFPSMDGLVWVDPESPILQFPTGNIYIDDIYADDKKISSSSLITPDFPPGTRELVFNLSYPAWVNNENLYVEYKLEPDDTAWRKLKPGSTPTLVFNNLSSGNHQLRIRKLNGFGAGNESALEMSFGIALKWYQRPLVRFFGLVCLLFGLVGFFNWKTWHLEARKNKLEKQILDKTKELLQKNEELERNDHIKTRLISIISHDMVPPLKFLHLASKNLTEKRAELPEGLQWETISEITNTSKELELLSTNVMNWIKYRNEDKRLARESFNLSQLTEQIFGIVKSMAKQNNVLLTNNVDADQILFQFIEPVKIVLYNLILNGINFTVNGKVKVRSEAMGEGIALIIEDTGVGMTQEQIDNIMDDLFIISSTNVDNRKGNGLGYLIIKDLLRIIRGKLTIQSVKEAGTKVTILLQG